MQREQVATQRERLCRALTGVVDERGWQGASPGVVARAAGLTVNDFYDCFRSPEHCYVAVYDGMVERLARVAGRALAGLPDDPEDDAWGRQLDAVIGAALWFFAVEPALARTCLLEVHNAGPTARARRDIALGELADFVEGLRLAHGQPMPPVAAEVIVLGTSMLIHRRVERGEAEQLPLLLPELRQMWASTLAGHAEPSAGDGVLALG
jgi:AcrR family transcriptional regulator